MKIFNWIRNKRNGTEVTIKPNPEPKSYDHMMHQQPEFSDWPNGLLTIGTFGTPSLKQSEKSLPPSTQDHDHLDRTTTTTEEEDIGKDLLSQLLDNNFSLSSSARSVEELLECLQAADEERERKDTHLQRTTSVVRRGGGERGGRDIRSDNKNKKINIGKKSLSFLIKKALLCKGGFGSTPMLKDPLPDPRLDHSRLEKILRAMLHKKIYPQRPTPRKCLEMPDNDSDEEEYEERSKWVKTDSEYIVLEI